MSFTQLPIEKIEGNIIKRSDGVDSHVYEYFPEDHAQMDQLSETAYLSGLRSKLLMLTNASKAIDQKSNIFEKVNAAKKRESLKFYKLEDRYFLESQREVDILNSKPVFDFYDYYLSHLGDFYSDIIFGEDFFKINGVYFRLINCYEFPDSIAPFSLSHLGGFSSRKVTHKCGPKVIHLLVNKNDPDGSNCLSNLSLKILF
jgi:hypothetical protein